MEKLKEIPSPLVDGAVAKRVSSIGRQHIIDRYRQIYRIDVSDYYCGIDEAEIFECTSTGYRFYYPFSLTGRESLYRELEGTSDGTYKYDKWEYRQALSIVATSAKVLDIGCGKGAFVRMAGLAANSAVGLELNSASAAEARALGLDVRSELVGNHARQNKHSYDFVCSFQVLEHISDVKQFLTDCLLCLRPGGTFILGVPNNESFVGLDRDAVLNMPPHHMGLWTKDSLAALTKVFPIELDRIIFEPLEEVDWYATVMERRTLTNQKIRSLYYRLGGAKLLRGWVEQRKSRIYGHTVMAVFRKAPND
jgi:2-polyprenyl-3-methyl-5-hydroxy-6-metoxy-1,4-benzoquinol methylase